MMSPILSFIAAALAAVQVPVVAGDGTRISGEPMTPELVARYVDAFPRIARINREAPSATRAASTANGSETVSSEQARTAEVLARAGLSRVEFNAVSRTIERHTALRRDVRQRIMDKRLGT